MENEKEINILKDFDIKSKNIFKPDYIGQNLDNNQQFINWKKEMIQEYGIDAKLFKCSKEKIFFFASKSKYSNYPFYQCVCPSCSIPICYFCSRYSNNRYGDCCLPRRICCMFLQDGFQFIAPIGDQKDSYHRYKEILSIFFIPVLGFLYFIIFIHSSLFYKLKIKNCEFDGQGILSTYEVSLKYFDLILIINAAFGIILVIPFSFGFLIFIIFLFIISLPFKQYPIKYFCGILFGKY